MAFGLDWIDARTSEIVLTVSSGTAIGTLWRMMTRPETDWKRFLRRALTALTVGPVIGFGIVQYYDLHNFVAVAVGSICSFMAEEILSFFEARGKRLRNGDIDLALKNGDDNDD